MKSPRAYVVRSQCALESTYPVLGQQHRQQFRKSESLLAGNVRSELGGVWWFRRTEHSEAQADLSLGTIYIIRWRPPTFDLRAELLQADVSAAKPSNHLQLVEWNLEQINPIRRAHADLASRISSYGLSWWIAGA